MYILVYAVWYTVYIQYSHSVHPASHNHRRTFVDFRLEQIYGNNELLCSISLAFQCYNVIVCTIVVQFMYVLYSYDIVVHRYRLNVTCDKYVYAAHTGYTRMKRRYTNLMLVFTKRNGMTFTYINLHRTHNNTTITYE